jgi:hypothetical protein
VSSRDEIIAQIQALQAEADSMGDGDDYEIEIWNPEGAGTRLPSKAGEGFLRKHFPELFTPDPADTDGTPEPDPGKAKPASKASPAKPATATRYFGKRAAGK